MNFVDPKEYDIPGLVRKNRYKTILPSEYLLPQGREGSKVLSSGKSSSPRSMGMMNDHPRRWAGGWDSQEREGNEQGQLHLLSLDPRPSRPGSEAMKYVHGLSLLSGYIRF